MKRLLRFWKVALLDTLGVLLMIAALLTGWLPGPGGIPLFIIGLSLLAINHDWAKRYVVLLKKYAHRLGEVVFVQHPLVQAVYDVLGLSMVAGGAWLVMRHNAPWMISAGIAAAFIGITLFLGNRSRWKRLTNVFKQKH